MDLNKISIHESNLELVRSRYTLSNNVHDEEVAPDINHANHAYVIVQIGQDTQFGTDDKTNYIRSVIWYVQEGKELLENRKKVGLEKGETIIDFFGSDIYRAPNNDGIILLDSKGQHRGDFFAEDLALAKSYAFLYWLMDQPKLRATLINRVYNLHSLKGEEYQTGGLSHDVSKLKQAIRNDGYHHLIDVNKLPTTDSYNFVFDLEKIFKLWK